MQITDVHTKLQEIHHNLAVNDDQLEMDQTFRGQGYDSLDQIEAFMECEKKFGIVLSDDSVSAIETPNQLADLILEQVIAHTPTSPDTATPVSS